MKTFNQAIVYLIVFLWMAALLKIILIYVHWNAETIFTAGCVLMTFGFIPSLFVLYRKKVTKQNILILIISIVLSVLAYLSGTLKGPGSFFPNFWISILLQAIALGTLSLVTTERRTILIIWIVWLSFSILMMAIHLQNGTL
jgi:hypothetical protein